MSKEEIIKQLQSVKEEFTGFCTGVDKDLFFHQPKEKWSVAQNVKHLIISANTTRLAFVLPKFIVRIYTGKPNRASRSYDELVNKYMLKLKQGGRASGIYIPKIISPQTGRETLLMSFNKSMENLITGIDKKWGDQQLDKYLAPHPLLGKITLRELCYFTIYHTLHHLDIIKQRLHDAQPITNNM
ncbi:MAG: DinB family protein [Chitinophagaceae bacterium]